MKKTFIGQSVKGYINLASGCRHTKSGFSAPNSRSLISFFYNILIAIEICKSHIKKLLEFSTSTTLLATKTDCLQYKFKVVIVITLLTSSFSIHAWGFDFDDIDKEINKFVKNLSPEDKKKIKKAAKDLLADEENRKKVKKAAGDFLKDDENKEKIKKYQKILEQKKTQNTKGNNDNDNEKAKEQKTNQPSTNQRNSPAPVKPQRTIFGKNIALDNFYNNEERMSHSNNRFVLTPQNYIWNDKGKFGYYKLGRLFQKFQSKLMHLKSPPSKENLSEISIYIIADPDSQFDYAKSGKNAEPPRLSRKAIKTIKKWVKRGGVLVLLADDWYPNDKEECEFSKFNKLAKAFDIKFNHESLKGYFPSGIPIPNQKINAPADDFFWQSYKALFKNVRQVYIDGGCSLKVWGKANSLIHYNGKDLAAYSIYGEGFVFVLNDPFFYNENINRFDNETFSRNLIIYLLNLAK